MHGTQAALYFNGSWRLLESNSNSVNAVFEIFRIVQCRCLLTQADIANRYIFVEPGAGFSCPLKLKYAFTFFAKVKLDAFDLKREKKSTRKLH